MRRLQVIAFSTLGSLRSVRSCEHTSHIRISQLGSSMRVSSFRVLALAGVLGMSLSVPAVADGMRYRDRPGCCAFSWTGFYVGVHAGYAWGESDWIDLLGTLGADVRFEDLRGGIGGGQLGFNWQSGPLVFGVEATLSGSRIDQTGRSVLLS